MRSSETNYSGLDAASGIFCGQSASPTAFAPDTVWTRGAAAAAVMTICVDFEMSAAKGSAIVGKYG